MIGRCFILLCASFYCCAVLIEFQTAALRSSSLVHWEIKHLVGYIKLKTCDPSLFWALCCLLQFCSSLSRQLWCNCLPALRNTMHSCTCIIVKPFNFFQKRLVSLLFGWNEGWIGAIPEELEYRITAIKVSWSCRGRGWLRNTASHG